MALIAQIASTVLGAVSKAGGLAYTAALAGLKPIKYFIDDNFRQKVEPIEGSVLYSDLWVAVEHSGIYIGDNKIANIVVDGFFESSVRSSKPKDFTAKSILGQKIYVSCDADGAVGDDTVCEGAIEHLGERAFYGLIIQNCHQFCEKCVNYADSDYGFGLHNLLSFDITMEPTLRNLKLTARQKLGATKWLLWDWKNDKKEPEPDWEAINNSFEDRILNASSIQAIKQELNGLQEYEAEISDEKIPEDVRKKLVVFRQTLQNIVQKYEEVKEFLALNQSMEFSYSSLKSSNENFAALATQMKNNAEIKKLVRKMGREYISEEKKRKTRVAGRNKDEIYGTHRSDDLMRLLPSELINLEDEELETLFYAKLLEKNLASYELRGAGFEEKNEIEKTTKTTGPIIACLDTSGSMDGEPLIKAKALLLAIGGILKKEHRSLYVLLFGGKGEIREFSAEDSSRSSQLLGFLRYGFGGGTDFETPLVRAFEIVKSQKSYKKADILVITDGDYTLSGEFIKTATTTKEALDCMIYTVLCSGNRTNDKLSDETITI